MKTVSLPSAKASEAIGANAKAIEMESEDVARRRPERGRFTGFPESCWRSPVRCATLPELPLPGIEDPQSEKKVRHSVCDHSGPQIVRPHIDARVREARQQSREPLVMFEREQSGANDKRPCTNLLRKHRQEIVLPDPA